MREGESLDERLRKELLRSELKERNNGKKIIRCKYRPKYPDSAEREYVRLINAYMTIEKEVLMKYIPEIKQILNDGTQLHTDSKKDNEKKRRTARFSALDNTIVRLTILFKTIQRELDSAFGLYDLKRQINRIANLDHKLTVREWKKAVSKTLGMECIIISTVDDEISDFTDDPYLINVAVSRAKKKLMLVVTGNKQSKERNITDLIDYIEYNNFEVVESKIYSVFDYLYKQYTEARKAYLQKHKKISAYDSENLMYSLIEDILSDSKYSSLDVVCHFPLNMLIKNPEFLSEEECRYAMNPATHLDFLIYNRISKKPVLAIEVDGYEYHKKHTVQASRDLLKNRIMESYEIPLLRFMTNCSGEKEKIIEMLDKRMEQ